MSCIISTDKYVFELRVMNDHMFSSSRSLVLWGRKIADLAFTYMTKWPWNKSDVNETDIEFARKYLARRHYLDDERNCLVTNYADEPDGIYGCGGSGE